MNHKTTSPTFQVAITRAWGTLTITTSHADLALNQPRLIQMCSGLPRLGHRWTPASNDATQEA